MELVIPTYWKAIDGVSAAMKTMTSATATYAQKTSAVFKIADGVISKHMSVLNHAQSELLSTFGAAAIAYKGIEAIDFGFDGIKEYDSAINKLQGNFKLATSQMQPFREGINKVANEGYFSAVEVTKAYDIIGSKNRDLISQPSALKEVAKNSLTLSEAWGTELEPTANSLINIMSAWNIKDSSKAIDILAAASSTGAVKGNDLADALGKIAPVAMAANMSLQQAGATFEYIDKVTNVGSQGVNGLVRNLLELKSNGAAYRGASGEFNLGTAIAGISKQLEGKSDLVKSIMLDKLLHLNSVRTANQALALFKPGAAQEMQEYTDKINQTGIAEQQAALNTATLDKAMERVGHSFQNALIASNNTSFALTALKNILVFVYTHMTGLLDVLGLLIAGFITWKALVIGATFVTTILDIRMGILGATTGIANIAIGESAVALGAYKIAAMFATTETIGLTTAMDANPIILLVTAIGLLGLGLYEAFGKSEKLNDSLTKGQEIAKKGSYTSNIDAIANKDNNIPLSQALSYFNSPEYKAQHTAAIIADLNAASKAQSDNQKNTADIPALNPELMRQNALIQRTETNSKQTTHVQIGLDRGLTGNITTPNENVRVDTTSTHGKVGNNN